MSLGEIADKTKIIKAISTELGGINCVRSFAVISQTKALTFASLYNRFCFHYINIS